MLATLRLRVRAATALLAFLSVGSAHAADPTAKEVFEKRLLPIFKSTDPSSCVQCHLAGVDLKQYILPDHEKTFRSLRDQGLIDLDQPEKSKILALIQRGADERTGAGLIKPDVRRMEYEAFAAWIKASAGDPALRGAPKLQPSERAAPRRPAEVIRHGRADRVLRSFENTVWALRFRCMGCHTEGSAENAKLVAEHGKRVAWVKAAGPGATLDYLRSSRLIDPKEPDKSLLLLKPLNAVKHGGGQKFLAGDQGYKAFRSFLEDYAKIVRDEYRDAETLPRPGGEPERFGTDVWIKLTTTPPAWGDRLLQVNVYAWDAAKADWEAEPIATSDRAVWGKGRLWQHNLTLLAASGSERAKAWGRGRATLPQGKYLVKVFVDGDGRVGRDWTVTLGPDDYAGKAEVQSAWPGGYGRMTEVNAAAVRR